MEVPMQQLLHLAARHDAVRRQLTRFAVLLTSAGSAVVLLGLTLEITSF
jgi:hypothetical protein